MQPVANKFLIAHKKNILSPHRSPLSLHSFCLPPLSLLPHLLMLSLFLPLSFARLYLPCFEHLKCASVFPCARTYVEPATRLLSWLRWSTCCEVASPFRVPDLFTLPLLVCIHVHIRAFNIFVIYSTPRPPTHEANIACTPTAFPATSVHVGIRRRPAPDCLCKTCKK